MTLRTTDIRGVAPPTRSGSRLHRARQAQFRRDFVTVSTLLCLPCLRPPHLYTEHACPLMGLCRILHFGPRGVGQRLHIYLEVACVLLAIPQT